MTNVIAHSWSNALMHIYNTSWEEMTSLSSLSSILQWSQINWNYAVIIPIPECLQPAPIAQASGI